MLEKREIETLYIFFRFFFSKYKYIDISSIDFHMEKSVANQIIGNFSAWKINDENKSGENKENILLRKTKEKDRSKASHFIFKRYGFFSSFISWLYYFSCLRIGYQSELSCFLVQEIIIIIKNIIYLCETKRRDIWLSVTARCFLMDHEVSECC